MGFNKYPGDLQMGSEQFSDYVNQLVCDNELDFAIASGSRFFGLEHGNSDIDLYVKSQCNNTLSFPSRGTLPIQVTTVSESEWRNVIHFLTPIKDTEIDNLRERHTEALAKLSIRLAGGKIFHTVPKIVKQINSFNFTTTKQKRMVKLVMMVSRSLEDAEGYIQHQDRLSAFHSLNIAAKWMVELVLTAVGDLYVGEHTAVKRLKRNFELSKESKKLIQIILGQSEYAQEHFWGDTESQTKSIYRFASYISFMASTVMINFWDQIGKEIEYHEDCLFVRNPFWVVVRLPDSRIGLTGLDRGCEVNESLARKWLYATNQLKSSKKVYKQLLDIGAVVDGK